MPQLLVKRSKIFLAHVDGAERRKVCPAGPTPQAMPAWIRDTDTYKNGLKDGSIMDLTEQARLQEAALAKEEGREPELMVEEDVEDDKPSEKAANAVPAGLANGNNKKRK
jgi:hypothetical protein